MNAKYGLIKPSDACKYWLSNELSHELKTRCEFVLIASTDGFELVLVPKFTFGAVLASLALELTGILGTPRICEGCGQWFMAEHGKLKHCTPSCKTKASRRRQAAKKEKTNG